MGKCWKNIMFCILTLTLPVLELSEVINVIPTDMLPLYLVLVAVVRFIVVKIKKE